MSDSTAANPSLPAALPRPLAPAVAAAANAGLYVSELLVICRCPTCGEPFGVRCELAADGRTTLSCPNGHAFRAADASIGMKTGNVFAQLRQAKAEVEQLRTLLATLPPKGDGPCDDVELGRRIEYLVRSAYHPEPGRQFPCRLCGSRFKERSYLRRHLKSFHADEIRRMPAASFC